jgi:hypothetical protein
MKIKSEQEINVIRGKMLVAHATREELHDFLMYVTAIEALVEEASIEDFFGTEGFRRRLGWD